MIALAFAPVLPLKAVTDGKLLTVAVKLIAVVGVAIASKN